jgi:NAD(P)-dependent dehydrogenase (short-subunit alcohol dehydrogenase family)
VSDLQGQAAIVTGAGRGLGRAIALRLAADGADIVIGEIDLAAAQSVADEVRALGSRALAVRADVSCKAEVQAMVQAALDAFGRVDVLVNNAGTAGPEAPLEDIPEEQWDRTLDVHLKGTFLCCQAVLPHMKAQQYGKIVNVASVAGKEGNPFSAPYCAAKAGIICLTKSVAREVAREGINVNAISPTVIATDFIKSLPQEEMAPVVARVPMGRMGTPEEVAALVSFLVSSEASFVTGACYDLSGGRAQW